MHHAFIRRCLKLAERGNRAAVSPNPLVGCVIVDDAERIVAEGAHEAFGAKHAETVALKKAGNRAHGAVLYGNLEPCRTEGKQPPCTDAIINAGIRTVVFGARDPGNGGSDILKNARVSVIGPILEAECRRVNRGFFSLIENGRPWVTVKKAMRPDASIDGNVTSKEQDLWSHRNLRATHDAILVGSGTILADDPQLNVRTDDDPPSSFSPRRIILDPHDQIPPSATVLTDNDADRTIVIREKLPIPALLERLKNEGIASVLVEGGPTVWQSFEESGCMDELVTLIGKTDTEKMRKAILA